MIANDGTNIHIEHPAAGVALITIDRPARRNAIDPATNAALENAFACVENDDAVRCVVLTGAGAGTAFCAGAEIPGMLLQIKANIERGQDRSQFGGITHMPITSKPVLAAINGVALGGGLEIALACDIRIASTTAIFGLPEVAVGILAGGGGCTRLPHTIAASAAAEMILAGEPIDAQRALALGLVSQVVAPEQLLPAAVAMASTIAMRAPLAVRACTKLLRRQRYTALQDYLREERAQFVQLLHTADATEGMVAFIEKRAPHYTGS